MSSSDSDLDMYNGDDEFDEEFSRFASVMNGMDLGEDPEEAQRKKKKRNMDDEEEEYEKEARHFPEVTKREVHRLPIKSTDGKLITFQPVEKEIKKEESEEEEEDSEEVEESEEEVEDSEETSESEEEEKEDSNQEEKNQPMTPEEIEKRIQAHFDKTKLLIASLSNKLVEDPETNVRRVRNQLSPLQQLIQFCYDTDKRVALLAILSSYNVFDNILPSYYIRDLTAEEREQKVTTKVKVMRQFEESLVTAYKSYLKCLKIHLGQPVNMKKAKKNVSTETESFISTSHQPRILVENCLKCICSLLRYHYEFNYVEVLIELILPWLRSDFPSFVSMCIEALQDIFKHDAQGVMTYDIVHQISMMIKRSNYQIHPTVLELFTLLPLKESLDENTVLGQRTKRRKLTELDKLLKESEGPDLNLKKAYQKDTLQEVFLTYFRILKHNDQNRFASLLPTVLLGLSQYGHLLNTDVVIDLLKLLKIQLDQNFLSFESSLYCIKTCFKLLSGPGAVLNLDEGVYIAQLYKLFPKIAILSNQQYLELFLECVSIAFISRKELLTTRVAAFIKQLFILSMNLTDSNAIATINLARRMELGIAVKINEEGRIASGVFNIDVETPEHSNASSTTCWEMIYLKHSYSPDIQDTVKSALQFKSLNNKDYWNTVLLNTQYSKIFQGELSDKQKNKFFTLSPEEESNETIDLSVIDKAYDEMKKEN